MPVPDQSLARGQGLAKKLVRRARVIDGKGGSSQVPPEGSVHRRRPRPVDGNLRILRVEVQVGLQLVGAPIGRGGGGGGGIVEETHALRHADGLLAALSVPPCEAKAPSPQGLEPRLQPVQPLSLPLTQWQCAEDELTLPSTACEAAMI